MRISIGSQAGIRKSEADAIVRFTFEGYYQNELGIDYGTITVDYIGTVQEVNGAIAEFRRYRRKWVAAHREGVTKRTFEQYNNSDRYSAKRIAAAQEVLMTVYKADGSVKSFRYKGGVI